MTRLLADRVHPSVVYLWVVISPLVRTVRALRGRSIGDFDHRCAAGALVSLSLVGAMAFRFDTDATAAVSMAAGQNGSARIGCHRYLPSSMFADNARLRAAVISQGWVRPANLLPGVWLRCGREQGCGLAGPDGLVGGLRRRTDNSRTAGAASIPPTSALESGGDDSATPTMRHSPLTHDLFGRGERKHGVVATTEAPWMRRRMRTSNRPLWHCPLEDFVLKAMPARDGSIVGQCAGRVSRLCGNCSRRR